MEYNISPINTPETVQANPKIIRGPYLQQGTESSIIICWATDVPVQGKVWYGLDPKRLSSTVTTDAIASNHKVKITGLMPDQKYYYSVGTQAGVQQGGSEDYFFVTAPASSLTSEQVRSRRIWVVGDCGRGNDLAGFVRDGYLKFTGTRPTDLWLMLGDNAL